MLVEVGAEISADHFVAGQRVDVTGISIGKGFAGAMKRHNFRRPAGDARRLGQPPQPRLDRQPPGSRPHLPGQEDGRSHGRQRVTVLNLEVVQTDVDARPDHAARRGAGQQGRPGCCCAMRSSGGRRRGCRCRRDPPRRPAHRPPRRHRLPIGDGGAEAPARGVTTMQWDVVNLASETVGTVDLADDVFGVEVRPDILARCVNWQLAKRRAGTHSTKTRRRGRRAPARSRTSRRAPAAPGRARRKGRTCAAAASSSARGRAITPSTCR